MYNFCITSERPLECKNPIFDEFEDETDIIIIILEYFKIFLPQVMSKKKDCYNKVIKIDPADIGVTVQKDYGDYLVILVPFEDNSSYSDDNFIKEDTLYVFQLQIEVREDDSEGALENILKLKSGIKTMLVNMYTNIGLNITIEGFSLDGPFGDPHDNNKFVRQGTYRFSIQDTRIKQ